MKKDGRQKGLESLGRPANEYVKKKFWEDNNSKISLTTDSGETIKDFTLGALKAGGDFDNTGEGGGEILPRKDANGKGITYKEFDINRKDPVTNNRDSKRFVSGSDGSVYYTDDHYLTFKRIK